MIMRFIMPLKLRRNWSRKSKDLVHDANYTETSCESMIKLPHKKDLGPINLINNKKVLLRERKRHTTCRAASVCCADLSWPEGYLPWLGGTYPGRGDLPCLGGTYPGWGVPTLARGVPTLAGVPPLTWV